MEEPATTSVARYVGRGSASGVDSEETERDRLDALAERLAEAMADSWREGERPLAEEFLERHPEVAEHPRAAARLIYEELCLREGEGEPISSEIVGRFPQWRNELEMLLDCHYLVRGERPGERFPEVGQTLGDYRLLAELGRGTRGRVFLAAQRTLADRPVVLKVTRRSGGEHLSMARLQHPNIMPLYAMHDLPDAELRVLCMPYLGGTSLEQVFALMSAEHPSRRTGAGLVGVLDRVRTDLVALPSWSTAREFLAGATYTRTICWIGACLAEALHYAHARGLLHLDLKPSNVLLADDGQPMLLDFHLAQAPLSPDSAGPARLGGTQGYMSPEQEAALTAFRSGRALATAVDGRSDVYSLGVLLFEALIGSPPMGIDSPVLLVSRADAHVGKRLVSILNRSLERDPNARYPNAAALAEDLRGVLEHVPTASVADRTFTKRLLGWWNSRRPRRG
jgi:serine/threonine protein kinase